MLDLLGKKACIHLGEWTGTLVVAESGGAGSLGMGHPMDEMMGSVISSVSLPSSTDVPQTCEILQFAVESSLKMAVSTLSIPVLPLGTQGLGEDKPESTAAEQIQEQE